MSAGVKPTYRSICVTLACRRLRSTRRRAQRDALQEDLRASQTEKAELASALEQAKHMVRRARGRPRTWGSRVAGRMVCNSHPTPDAARASRLKGLDHFAVQGTPQGDAAKKRLPEVMDSLRCAVCSLPSRLGTAVS